MKKFRVLIEFKDDRLEVELEGPNENWITEQLNKTFPGQILRVYFLEEIK